MSAVLKTKVNYDLLKTKFADYHVTNPSATLKKRLSELDPASIAQTMEKFLPEKNRRIFAANHYAEIVDANKQLIRELLDHMS